jgi:Fic family protein
MFNSVDVWLPPKIAGLAPTFPSTLVTVMDDASRAITVLDQSVHADALRAVSSMLLRTESVASSKIEHVEASITDYARAMHGSKANPSAVSMVAATSALHAMIDDVTESGHISLESLTTAHQALMKDDPNESTYAGRVRDMQNWIGGSNFSPRGALFVPPPPETVDDLIIFANRDDVPVLAQAAIAHAQFESIHPFTDGNGRIGRALVNTILRRRSTTTNVVIPIASAIVGRTDHYFDLLGEYRDGRAAPIVLAFANASRVAALESLATAKRLREIPEDWRARLGRVRSRSATHQLLEAITSIPVLSADDASKLVDAPTSGVYASIQRLVDAEILTPLTQSKRNQIWGAVDILDELEDLSTRIEIAARLT